jgi:hypothetical protein
MMSDGELRRIFPPARRRPNPLVVGWRWWFELTVLGGAAAGAKTVVDLVGPDAALWIGVVALIGAFASVVLLTPAQDALAALALRFVVPHRARVGFIQAGVVNRDGRLPMIVRSRCRRAQARLWLWLPAGVIADDLEAARALIATSCGAAEVVVIPNPHRYDRALLIIVRPRWGWPA